MDQSKSLYLGNRDLPVEVKDRVLSTYHQSVELYEQGRTEEAIAGCELILSMDGAFVPARKLLEKMRNAAMVDIGALSPGSGGEGDALEAARKALESRDFQRAIELSNALLRAEFTNQQAQDIGREAQEKIEAGPFVDQFLSKAQTHIAAGNLTAARAELEKARSLDPGHPRIRQVERVTQKASEPAPSTKPVTPAVPPSDFRPTDSPFLFDFEAGKGASADAEGSSFILEEPSVESTSRSAHASDFGFSFEEDQVQVPPEEPASGKEPVFVPGEAQTFDFATASVETTAEERDLIDELLKQGDAAFEDAAYVQATEIWSRIFLIDVTNAVASERIEKARRLQLELDARVEEILTSSILAFESGDFATARRGFEQTLRLDRHQPSARDYLQKIPADAPEPDLTSIDFDPPPLLTEPEEDLYATYGIPLDPNAADLESPGEGVYKPGVPPDSGSGAAFHPQSAAVTKPAKRRGGLIVVLGAILLLAAAGWLAWSKFGAEEPAAGSSQTALILSRAQALAKAERYDQAIDLLSSVNADDPRHDQALALIAEYRDRKSAEPGAIDGRPAAAVFQELIGQGRAAFMSHDYMAAKDALERAAAIQPLPAEATAILGNSTQQVRKLDSALVLFKEGKYAAAVPVLEGLLQQNPEHQNVRQLLENAHFNLGATALREDRLADAVREFDSVLATNPNDDLARRSREIAERYNEQSKDLLFKIYVKYLPLR